MNLYEYMGITNENFKVRKIETMRRRHAVRLVLLEHGLNLSEIARLEKKFFGVETNHTTIMNSRDVPRDKIIDIHVIKAKDYLSKHPQEALG